MQSAVLNTHVLALGIAGIGEALAECAQPVRECVGRRTAEKTDQRQRRLLRTRHQRPRHRRAAHERDELAPPHRSITSSARASTEDGISRPSVQSASWWMLLLELYLPPSTLISRTVAIAVWIGDPRDTRPEPDIAILMSTETVSMGKTGKSNKNRLRVCTVSTRAREAEWELGTFATDKYRSSPYHVVFTLPAQIADIAYQNKAVIYDLLFKASSETMLTIAADPKHLGARIGILSVTWGSAVDMLDLQRHHLPGAQSAAISEAEQDPDFEAAGDPAVIAS
jgi:hypothetical protein